VWPLRALTTLAVLPQHLSHRRRRHTIMMTRSSASARRVYEEACLCTMGVRTAETYRTDRTDGGARAL
jgi:hypothetical protein